jgi:hypothetical protein
MIDFEATKPEKAEQRDQATLRWSEPIAGLAREQMSNVVLLSER